MTVKLDALRRFLEQRLIPHLGAAWRVCSDHSVVRIDGVLLQGICMDRSSTDDLICPTPFIQILARHDDALTLTLGERLHDVEGRECWLDWRPEEAAFAEQLVQTVRAQAMPLIDLPLTLELVEEYIKRRHLDADHFTPFWSLGILAGLKGHMAEADTWLGRAEKDLHRRADAFIAAHGSAPEWLNARLSQLATCRAAAADPARFADYCDREAATTKSLLKVAA